MMLVQASERRSSFGRPSRTTVRIASSSPGSPRPRFRPRPRRPRHPHLPAPISSPVNNAENGAIPGVSGRRKYSRLQGPCLLRANSVQIRAPVDACQAASVPRHH
jgi:hypothetical protein